jgi:hypothetical protein
MAIGTSVHTSATGSSVTSQTVVVPASAAQGPGLVVVFAHTNVTSDSVTISGGTGTWTSRGSVTFSTNHRLYLWTKSADPSDTGNYTVDLGGTFMVAIAASYHPWARFYASQTAVTAASDTPIDCASVDTTAAYANGCRILTSVGINAGSANTLTVDPDFSGMTSKIRTTNETAPVRNVWCVEWDQPSRGATGTIGHSSASATTDVSHTVALEPMPMETLRPTGVSGLSNLTGAVTDIDQDPDGTITDAGLVGSDPSGTPGTITHEGGADNTGNPTTSTSITIPATVNNNDIITVSAVNAGATATGSISDNSGVGSWSNGTDGGQVATANGNTMAGTVWWKRITNQTSERSATISISGMTDSTCANLGIYRGCVTSGSPIDGTPVGEANASANNTQAGITTLTDNAMVCLSIFYSDNTNVTTAHAATSPASLTERAEITSSGGADSGISHASAIKTTAGATGNFTWSPGTNQISISIAFALKPALIPQTVNTQADVAMADPTGTLKIGALTGEIRARFRKKGTGSNPQGRIELRQAGATVATPIVNTTVTESDADGQLVGGSFDQDLIDGAPTDVTCRFVGTGAAGGLCELVAVEWNAELFVAQPSLLYRPFTYRSSLYLR